MKKILTTYVPHKLDNALVVWSPHVGNHTELVQRSDRARGEWCQEQVKWSVWSEWKFPELPTLDDRKGREDMITILESLGSQDGINTDLICNPEKLQNQRMQ